MTQAVRSPWWQQLARPLRDYVNARTADADWQSSAAVHPVARWVARRQARKLFDLCSGFVYSQTLVACDALALFEPERQFPVTAAQLSAERSPQLCPERLERLFDGAVALGLLERTDGGYRLGAAGAALTGNPGVRAMVRHNRFLYEDLATPLTLLEPAPGPSALSRYWAYAGAIGEDADEAAITGYSALMAASQRFIVEQVLAAMDFRPYRHVMDLGGGTGAFLDALGAAWPSLQRTLFDLPPVIERARSQRGRAQSAPPRADATAPASTSLTLQSGDLFGSLPAIEADLVTLVRVLHDHDDEPVQSLLGELHRRMRTGATLMIAEPLAGRRGAEGSQAYFAAYFLAMSQGRLRTRRELEALLRTAGFTPLRSPATPVPMLVEILLARA